MFKNVAKVHFLHEYKIVFKTIIIVIKLKKKILSTQMIFPLDIS